MSKNRIIYLPEFATLAVHLKMKRKLHGWSQHTLAQKAGVSQSLIAKLEQQANTPNYQSIWNIWKALQEDEIDEKISIRGLPSRIVSVDATDTVHTAGQLMKQHDFSQLPVTHHDHYIGMVTSKNIVGIDPATKVSEVMQDITILSRHAPRAAIETLVIKYNAILLRGEGNKMWFIR